MENKSTHYVSVVIACTRTNKESEVHCLKINRGIPPELRCIPSEGRRGNSDIELWTCSYCRSLGQDLDKLRTLVERELRDNFQEAKRNGEVLIKCNL